MIQETFRINDSDKYRLDVYIQDTSREMEISQKRPFVLVCPGGGYFMTSDREADPIALAYMADGFHAGVLRYSVGEDATYPNPMIDLSVAIKIVRDNAKRWNVESEKIAVCGFSAGGHLVAMQGVHWNDPCIMELSGCLNGENKPNALILGYPVITSCNFAHDASIKTLLKNYVESENEEELDKMMNYIACENHVGAHTPPTFLFHTFSDRTVPVMNSILFAKALAENNIDFEMHIFEQGEHGLALANHVTDYKRGEFDSSNPAAAWVKMSCRWLWNHFK